MTLIISGTSSRAKSNASKSHKDGAHGRTASSASSSVDDGRSRQSGKHTHEAQSKKAEDEIYTSKDAANDVYDGACLTAWPADEPYYGTEHHPPADTSSKKGKEKRYKKPNK
ncbi:hypothetical protein GQ53DRAFT_816734 [Thozetella sp. PMI_491]|nr:hypothetical protein GQ53DRAFT_816734 [Thozetella sp. PMI_491]